MPTLRLAIDSAKAEEGARDYAGASEKIQTSNKNLDKSRKDVQKGLDNLQQTTSATSKNNARNTRNAANSIDKANQKIRSSSKNVEKRLFSLSNTTTSLTGKMLRLGSVLGVTFALKDAADTIIGFEKTMASLRAVTGATTAELTLLESISRDLGATTAFSAQEAGEGLLFLARAGFSVAESAQAIRPTLNLAIASNMELGRSADIVSNVLGQFALQADETERVVDVLALTANSANTNIEQLATGLELAGPIAKTLNISIEETAAAIGKLSDAGIQGEKAGTGLRGILSTLAAPAGAAKKVLTELGLAEADVSVQTNGLIPVLDLLAKKNLTGAQLFKLFGREGASAAAVLLSSSNDVNELTIKLAGANGTAQETADIMGDTLSGKLKGLNSAMEELYLQTGDKGLAGGLKDIVEAATELLRALGGADATLNETKDDITAASAAGQVLARTLNGLIVVWEGFKTAVIGATLGIVVAIDNQIRQVLSLGNRFIAAKDLMVAGWNILKLAISGDTDAIKLVFLTFVRDLQLGVSDLLQTLSNVSRRIVGFNDIANSIAETATSVRLKANETGALIRAVSSTASDESKQAAKDFTDAFDAFANAGDSVTTGLEDNITGLKIQLDNQIKVLDDATEKLIQQAGAQDDANKRLVANAGNPLPEAPLPETSETATSVIPAVPQEVIATEEQEKKFEAIKNSFKSELDLLESQFNEKRDFIASLEDVLGIDQAERREAALALEAEYENEKTRILSDQEDARKRIASRAWGQRIQVASMALGTLQNLLELSGNKSLAESKAFGIAQAVISTAEGIARSLELPPWMWGPAIAFATTTGLAQIAAITSASKGSGSVSGASASGSVLTGSTPPQGGTIDDSATQQQNTQPVQEIKLDPGAYMSTEVFAELYNKAKRNGQVEVTIR